jgi:excisionase family DNA binding protein
METKCRLLTTTAAARALDVSPGSVRRLVQDGDLEATFVGGRWLVSESAVAALLDGEDDEHTEDDDLDEAEGDASDEDEDEDEDEDDEEDEDEDHDDEEDEDEDDEENEDEADEDSEG